MANVPFFQVDAFTEVPFAGNPAAVCLLQAWPDDAVLRAVAAENNLSETAFVVALDGVSHLRWFTPAAEVPLCGHGTLAAAHACLPGVEDDEITFHTKSGPLHVVRTAGTYRLSLPALPASPCPVRDSLVMALGATPSSCLSNEHTYVAVFESQREVAELAPDFDAILALDRRYVAATAPGDDVDFVSRFFAPAVGVPEDPVTGSAHCVLAPYWAERLGRDKLAARQISARGGNLGCEIEGDRVHVSGRARTIIEGMFHFPD